MRDRQISQYGFWEAGGCRACGGAGMAQPPHPLARRAAGVAAQLLSPGVKGRGDGAALESCVLFFSGGGTGK